MEKIILKNVILIGLKNSGKTTLGKLLSQTTDYTFIDTDICIEKLYQKKQFEHLTCAQIYKTKGKKYFRQLEKEIIFSLTTVQKSIIAVGGGALYDPQIQQFLTTIGNFFYLKISFDTFVKRILKNPPVFLDKKNPISFLKTRFEKKTTIFKSLAQKTLAADKLMLNEMIEHISHGIE